MIVSRIIPATGRGSRQPTAHNCPAEEPSASHAVVPLNQTIRRPALGSGRPDASFVAHLIAMADHAPQTRTLRRATPADARPIYDRAMALAANDHGKVLSQTA